MNRRQFLKGLGASGLLLPILPAFNGYAAQDNYPKRFVVFKFPEGTERSTWFPSNNNIITPAFESLRPYENQMTIIKGLQNSASLNHHRNGMNYPGVRGGNDFHDVAHIHLLSGGRSNQTQVIDGLSIKDGESLDRIIGKKLHADPSYQAPPQLGLSEPAYHLGVNTRSLGGNYANTCSCISYPEWQQFTYSEDNPVKCFESLLSHIQFDGQNLPTTDMLRQRRKWLMGQSVLDDVYQEAKSIQCKLGHDGQNKLESYLTSVREIEKQLTNRINAQDTDSPTNVPKVEGLERFNNEDWRRERYHKEIGKLQMDIAVSALAADAKRVLTINWSHTISDIRFKEDGLLNDLRIHGDHHAVAHEERGVDDSKHDKRIIDRFYADQLAYFVNRLASITEGSGTLLDNTLILFCSEMGYGTHDYRDLPFMLLGMGDVFKHNSIHTTNNRAQNDVLTAIAQGFDVNLRTMGDPTLNRSPMTELLK